jgi:hypothetical protein
MWGMYETSTLLLITTWHSLELQRFLILGVCTVHHHALINILFQSPDCLSHYEGTWIGAEILQINLVNKRNFTKQEYLFYVTNYAKQNNLPLATGSLIWIPDISLQNYTP